MNLQGRKVIKVAYTEVNENNIIDILSKALPIHLSNIGEINYLFNYYKGLQPILNREKKYRKEVNNKIVENHANEIVAFKVGYLLWKPIQYIARKDNKGDAMELFNDDMLLENKEGKDKEIAKHQSICGTSYRLTEVNKKYEEGRDESPFTIRTIFPTKAFVVYTDEFDSKPLLGVFVDKIMVDGVEVTRLQAYSDKFKYTIVNNLVVGTPESHSLGEIPLVEYPLNEERMGDFEKVIGLLDAINTIQSNRVDGVEQFIQSLLVFKNVDLDDENFKKLKEDGAIKIKDNGELEANVSYLTQELNQQQVQSLKNDLYNVVLKIVGMPAQNDGNKSISANNGAVAISNGWQGADARASDTEIMFKTSERLFLKIALRIAKTLTKNRIDLNLSDIDIKFTRRNYEDLWVKTQTLTALLNQPKVAPRLAFVACGLFPDAEQAYEESSEYYANYQKEQKELLSKKDNTTDETDE